MSNATQAQIDAHPDIAKERLFDTEQEARDARRVFIRQGRLTSLLVFDPVRGKYVFDLY